MLHISGFMTAYILTVAGVFGAVFGSFINCMAWRIAHNESVLKGRSHCAVCNHPLGVPDLIPVFSYMFLRGRCRYCKSRISPRYMITELIMAVAFVVAVYTYDVSFDALRYIVLACILMGLALVDFEIYEIPDRFIAAGIVWWAVTLPITSQPWLVQLKSGLAGGFAVGVSMLVLSLLFDKVTGKESLGGGDIKLFFMTGLYLGPWVSLFNLILSCIIGLLFVIFMKKKRIPFGPSIAAAAYISALYGRCFVDWYLNLF